MSKEIGVVYKSRIAEFVDDASIEEAFSLYHYGIANYTTGTPAANSIEGNFTSLNTSITNTNTTVSSLATTVSNNFSATIKTTSDSATPNEITPANASTIPLTIKAFSGQTANLQEWEDSGGAILSSISSSGNLYITNLLTNASYSNTAATASQIVLRKSRGTVSVPAVIVNGDAIGSINFSGYNGSSYINAATIIAEIDNVVTSGSNDMPGRIIFSTTADGSATLTERLRIDSTGRIKIPAGGVLEAPVATTSPGAYPYTLALTDAGKLIEMNSSSAITLNVPLNATVSFPIGTKIDILRVGTGEVTISGVSGVTVNSEGPNTRYKINSQWQAATLIKRGTDSWVLIGALKV